MEVLDRVQESTKRVALDAILNGQLLLRWTTRLEHRRHSIKFKASALQFQLVEESLLQMREDVSMCSTTSLAEILRTLAQIPGFTDYLLHAEPTGVEALHAFVADFAAFKQQAADGGRRFRANDVVSSAGPVLS